MKETIKMPVSVHTIQADIWRAIELGYITEHMSLREIGKIIDETSPQKIKHHLEQLRKLGTIDFKDGQYLFIKK